MLHISWLWNRRAEDTEVVEVELELLEPEDSAEPAIIELEERVDTLDLPEEEPEAEEDETVEVEAEAAEEPEIEKEDTPSAEAGAPAPRSYRRR